MALTSLVLSEVCKRTKAGARIASMGYPDIIAPLEEVWALLGERTAAHLEYRDDSEDICRRHLGTERRKVPDAKSFFSLLGARLDVFDIVQERGDEILCDLNEPMRHTVEYDIVIDPGTLEHCFNIAQAAFNMANLVKLGGAIFHENPFNWGNHGLYGLNPTWYHDFYESNGFKLVDCRLIYKGGEVRDVPRTQRFVYTGPEANLFAVAERIEVVQMRYPVQTKYRRAA